MYARGAALYFYLPHCTYSCTCLLTALSTCREGPLVFYSASLSDTIAPHADGRLAKAAMRHASEGTAIG